MGSVAESGAVTPSSGKKYGRNNNNMKSGIRRESGATCKRLGNAKSSGSCSVSAPGEETNASILKFSFSACGWLKAYQFGVGKALQELIESSSDFEHGCSTDATHHRYCGSSGGALVAAVLALGIDPSDVLEQILGFVRHCRKSYFRAFRIREYVVRCIAHFDEVYERNRKRLLSGLQRQT